MYIEIGFGKRIEQEDTTTSVDKVLSFDTKLKGMELGNLYWCIKSQYTGTFTVGRIYHKANDGGMICNDGTRVDLCDAMAMAKFERCKIERPIT